MPERTWDYPRAIALMAEFAAAVGRDCSVARYTPLSEDPSPWQSRLLGSGLLRRGEPWPTWEGRPMNSLLQVNLAEVPVVPEALQGYAWLGVYLDAVGLGLLAGGEGEGWALKLYRTLEGLEPRAAPPYPEKQVPWRAQAITWERHRDLPDALTELGCNPPPPWQDLFDVVPITAYMHRPRGQGRWNARRTKLGGYPSAHQWESGPSLPENFVFQILAELHVFDLCDCSTTHVGIVDGRWVLESQTS